MPSAIFITMKYSHTHTQPCQHGLGYSHYNEAHIDKQISNQTPAFNPVVLNEPQRYGNTQTHSHFAK